MSASNKTLARPWEAFYYDIGKYIEISHHTNFSVMNNAHAHPQYEIYFCTQNVEQTTVINGIDHSYKHPAVIISAPYTIHAMSCCNNGDSGTFDRYVLYFNEKLLDHFDKSLLPCGIETKNMGLLFKLDVEQVKELASVLEMFENSDETQMELLTVLFLNKLFSFCPIDKAVKVGTSSFYIQDIIQYIAEHYYENIDSTHLAERFNISRSKLDRDFKHFTRNTVHSFIDTCRINQAKAMLLRNEGRMSISEISKSIGFDNESYFFTYFKKHTGSTPIEFRKSSGSNRLRR